MSIDSKPLSFNSQLQYFGLGLLALLAILLVVGWQHRIAGEQRVADRDARCAGESMTPPPPFKRSLTCFGWSPKASQTLPEHG